MTLRKLLPLKIACAIGLGVFLSHAAYALDKTPDVTADKTKVVGTLGMVRQLRNKHYSKRIVGDQLSSDLLDSYIDNLDPAKAFFSEADIDGFESFRYQLDNDIKVGDVDAAYDIFNLFQERASNRLQDIYERLPQIVSKLDFDKKEYLSRDTENLPWAPSQQELDNRWRKRIKNEVLSLKLADKDTDDIIELLQKRYKRQLTRINEINSDDVYTRYMNAYAALYDPHTSHFLPKQRKNFDINMSRSLEGIGAVLSRDDEFTKVVRLVTGGPAKKQGELKPSDKIIGVGQGQKGEVENVVGWRLDEVVDLIRGPKNSFVRLQVTSKKEQASGTSRFITIKRGKVELEDSLAKSELLDVFYEDKIRKVGVISIPDFYADMEAQARGDKNYRSVTRDVRRLLGELQRDGAEGIVIDLRNNGGGSLTEANRLTKLFVGSQPTVQIRHASGRRTPPDRYRGSLEYSGPLVVLINRLSASASEIFAGAIQDYQRGLVVGTNSFGKGTVQTILPLAEGAIKLTTAKFYRVSGGSTQYRGVTPDIMFPAVFDPEEVGESALEYALPWDTISAVRYKPLGSLGDLKSSVAKRFENRSAKNPDFVFYKQEYELSLQQKQDNLIPLQLQERQDKQQQVEAAFLALENTRRVAKGMEPLASIDDLEEDVKDDDEAAADEPEETSFYDDAYVMEAANILLDSIELRHSMLAARN